MSRKLAAAAIALVLGLGLLGCSRGPAPMPKEPDIPATLPDVNINVGQELNGLDQLSEADRKLAEKQKVCPVSGEALGTMGKPVKVKIKGRDVFVCCDGCKEAIEKEPDKYLAKLDKQ